MTTFTMSAPMRKIVGSSGSDNGSWRDMLKDTKVAITLIIMGGVAVLGLLAGLVVLALKGADAAQVMAAVSLILNAVLLARLEATRSKVDTVQQQTNGTQTRLIEAAINAQPPAP